MFTFIRDSSGVSCVAAFSYRSRHEINGIYTDDKQIK